MWTAGPADAAAPAGFSDKLVTGGLNLPTTMEFAPDGRLFVSEKDGAVRVVKDGSLLSAPFASLPVNSEGERGLQGIAFDPAFASNRYLYVYYTTSADPVHNRVSRLTADPSNPDVMLAGSELPILDLESLATASHNGGALEFGPDGKLYVSTGDNYYPHLAQSLTSRFGKILRINPDGTIPADNPFYNTAGAYREIWALGLRNPFSFAFSPEGVMHVNDVGQDGWEEVNLGVKRANYGWPVCEGMCPDPRFADPIHSYPHPSDMSGSSVAGGAFYGASQFPSEFQGSYFFGDYAAGFIKRLPPPGGSSQAVDFLADINSPVDLEVGPTDGNLYYLSIVAGEVRRVQYTTQGNYEPVAVAVANQTRGLPPLAINFDGSGSTDPNSGDALSYSWEFDDGTAPVAGAQVTHVYNMTGAHVATLEVSDGKGGTSTDTVEVMVGNPPAGTIEAPPQGAMYSAGDVISFVGSARDAEDGPALPASAFSWKIDFHHNTHIHPFQEFAGVRSGSFTIPTVGETDDDVWYRINLAITDSSGLTHESSRDIRPNESTVTLSSNVTGLELALDGQPRITPHSFVGVVGVQRTLEAPATQVLDGRIYDFQSWSDGGARVHTVTMPPNGATLTAYYSAGAIAPQHTVTVRSADLSGNTLTGHHTTIESSAGTVLETGYTPVNFTGYDSTKYTVTTRDYRNSTFDHWDDGSTSRGRAIALNNNTVMTAYFRTVDGTTIPQATYNLTVSSADLTGNVRTGHYATIESDGAVVHTGYSPLTYAGTPGNSYTVTPQDIEDVVFDHWENGSTDRARNVMLDSNRIVTAYYKNITQTDPPVAVGDLSGGSTSGGSTSGGSTSGGSTSGGSTSGGSTSGGSTSG
ncbi:MAG: PQQ-dependent sugar dehydrogenase, partial [Nitrososphaera sp.]